MAAYYAAILFLVYLTARPRLAERYEDALKMAFVTPIYILDKYQSQQLFYVRYKRTIKTSSFPLHSNEDERALLSYFYIFD